MLARFTVPLKGVPKGLSLLPIIRSRDRAYPRRRFSAQRRTDTYGLSVYRLAEHRLCGVDSGF
jgi:hypothetical protein